MPRDNFYGGHFHLPWTTEYTSSTGNLSEMFEEKRKAKVKISKDLEKQVRELTEENTQIKPRLMASRKEVSELKERVKYLEAAIEELEGKNGS